MAVTGVVPCTDPLPPTGGCAVVPVPAGMPPGVQPVGVPAPEPVVHPPVDPVVSVPADPPTFVLSASVPATGVPVDIGFV